MSPHLQDYVIVHEILHFRVPNHGKLWKSLMRAHLGEYEQFEKELKQIERQTCGRNEHKPNADSHCPISPLKR